MHRTVVLLLAAMFGFLLPPLAAAMAPVDDIVVTGRGGVSSPPFAVNAAARSEGTDVEFVDLVGLAIGDDVQVGAMRFLLTNSSTAALRLPVVGDFALADGGCAHVVAADHHRVDQFSAGGVRPGPTALVDYLEAPARWLTVRPGRSVQVLGFAPAATSAGAEFRMTIFDEYRQVHRSPRFPIGGLQRETVLRQGCDDAVDLAVDAAIAEDARGWKELSFSIRNDSDAALTYNPGALPWMGGPNVELKVVEIGDEAISVNPLGVIADPPRTLPLQLGVGATLAGNVMLENRFPGISARSADRYVFVCWSFEGSRAFAGQDQVFSGCELVGDPVEPD